MHCSESRLVGYFVSLLMCNVYLIFMSILFCSGFSGLDPLSVQQLQPSTTSSS